MQFGQVFKDKRESLGLTLEHIEEDTKIRKLYLDAIEKERFNLLPPRVYATGFVRKYARYLHLDEAEMVNMFVEMAYGHEEAAVAAPPQPKRRRPDFQQYQALNWRNVVVAGAFLLAALWVGNMVVGAISNHSPNVVQKDPAQQQNPPAAQPNGANNKTDTNNKDNAINPALSATVRVSALSDCWVKAIVDGQTVFSSTLTAGQEKVFEGREAVLLTVGNAGGIEVYYNGEKIGPLGEKGEVIQKEFLVARLSS